MKVEKREINLTHFYGIFYLLASLSLSNPECFDWLCHNFPIPGASLSALFSAIWGSLCSLFFLSLQATQLKERLIYLAWYLLWQSFSLCSRSTHLGDSSLAGVCVCENSKRWVNSFKKSFSMAQTVCKDFERKLNLL